MSHSTPAKSGFAPDLGDMNKEDFRRFGHEFVDWIADYFERIEDLPVLAAIEPGSLKAQLPEAPPQHGEPMDRILADLDRLGSDPAVHAVVLPRTQEQREAIRAATLPSVLVPERAVDALSLVALADLVVSAGGTMNREAVALGTPVYTTFTGRMGAVDERLLAEGRLRALEDASAVAVERKHPAAPRATRDPALLLDLMLTAL